MAELASDVKELVKCLERVAGLLYDEIYLNHLLNIMFHCCLIKLFPMLCYVEIRAYHKVV